MRIPLWLERNCRHQPQCVPLATLPSRFPFCWVAAAPSLLLLVQRSGTHQGETLQLLVAAALLVGWRYALPLHGQKPLVNPSSFAQYLTHRWHSRERTLMAQHWTWELSAPNKPRGSLLPGPGGNIQPEIPSSFLGMMNGFVSSTVHGTGG